MMSTSNILMKTHHICMHVRVSCLSRSLWLQWMKVQSLRACGHVLRHLHTHIHICMHVRVSCLSRSLWLQRMKVQSLRACGHVLPSHAYEFQNTDYCKDDATATSTHMHVQTRSILQAVHMNNTCVPMDVVFLTYILTLTYNRQTVSKLLV